jgi:hypothetical protein
MKKLVVLIFLIVVVSIGMMGCPDKGGHSSSEDTKKIEIKYEPITETK